MEFQSTSRIPLTNSLLSSAPQSFKVPIPPPVFESAGNNTSTCLTFINGTCKNDKRCRYEHKFNKKGVVFCREFAKSNMCKRQFCRLIHATQHEQKCYKEKGVIMPSLQDRMDTYGSINNLIQQNTNIQQWNQTRFQTPQSSVPGGSTTNVHVMPVPPNNHVPGGYFNYSNSTGVASAPFVNHPAPPPVQNVQINNQYSVNTAVPPPTIAISPQYSFNMPRAQPPRQQTQPNYQTNWTPVNQPSAPLLNANSNNERQQKQNADYNPDCHKCSFNNNRYKESQVEMEQLMQQHADLVLEYNNLVNLFKELKMGAVTILKDCHNPNLRSLLENLLELEETQEQDRITSSYNHLQPAEYLSPMQQHQLSQLLSEQKRRLSTFKADLIQ